MKNMERSLGTLLLGVAGVVLVVVGVVQLIRGETAMGDGMTTVGSLFLGGLLGYFMLRGSK